MNPGFSTKTKFEPLQTLPKKPELRTYMAKNGPNLGQNLANQTLDSSEPNFVHQNWTMNLPESPKNPNLWTHELGLTQHYIVPIIYREWIFVKCKNSSFFFIRNVILGHQRFGYPKISNWWRKEEQELLLFFIFLYKKDPFFPQTAKHTS